MKFVALLRGIMPMNPNMRNEKLRGVLEELGLAGVQTVISSGNVLFESEETDSRKLEDLIEPTWQERLGFNSTTIIRSQAELQHLVDSEPFKGMDDSPTERLNVTFLKDRAGTDFKFPYEGSGYRVIGERDRAIFSVVDLSGASSPEVMKWLEKQFGKEITTRTWKTVHRILKKFG